ncbi:MAG: DUF6090 family protein [Saprospiraceae bacterium]|nr:DUF6090 family protein [Saprospiraceae bacterium]
MLTFFRKIRQALIHSGSFRKYFLYASGEIMLVVIGILLALQVNNWNQEAQERKREHKLLSQLEVDLKKCLVDVNGNILIHDKIYQSAHILMDHLDSDLPYHDSLAKHFSSAFLWSRTGLNEGAYELIY